MSSVAIWNPRRRNANLSVLPRIETVVLDLIHIDVVGCLKNLLWDVHIHVCKCCVLSALPSVAQVLLFLRKSFWRRQIVHTIISQNLLMLLLLLMRRSSSPATAASRINRWRSLSLSIRLLLV